MNDVSKNLSVGEIADAELMHILLTHFGCSQYSSSSLIDFPDFDKSVLSAHFSKAGQLTKISSSLENEQLEILQHQIRRVLKATPNLVNDKSVQFSGKPIIGKFECQYFSIFEIDETAPKPAMMLADHPFVLEVPFLEIGDSGIDSIRRIKARNEIVLLLGLFTLDTRVPNNRSKFFWGLDSGDFETETEKRRSKWLQKIYLYEERVSDIDWAEYKVSLPNIRLIEDREYLSISSISFSEPYVLPKSLGKMFSFYFSLPDSRRKQFLRASYWFNHARNSISESSSATLISLVQAIETLIPNQPSARCSECGAAIGSQLKKTFLDFLNAYAPISNSSSSNVRNLLYDQRSRLVHGDGLFVSDQDIFNFSNPKLGQEMELTQHAFQSVRVALWNWLDRNE